jgi:DNA-binding response OmpR family regulator
MRTCNVNNYRIQLRVQLLVSQIGGEKHGLISVFDGTEARAVRGDQRRLRRPEPMTRRAATNRARRAQASYASPLRVALLDRDSGFVLVLAKRLERLEWKHRALSSAATADAFATMPLDALIVDLAAVGPKRWDWLEHLCDLEPDFAIVVCTGASTTAERVRALRAGVDDWLGKPCHPEELIARVEAVVGNRPRSKPRDVEPVTIGEVEIRRHQYQAFVAERSLKLTPREYQLIELFAAAGGETIEREAIYERMWGYTMSRNDRSVDVFVHKLRRKLERASPGWRYVHTHLGVGYSFAAERVEGSEAAVRKLRPRREPATSRLAA